MRISFIILYRLTDILSAVGPCDTAYTFPHTSTVQSALPVLDSHGGCP